MSPGGSWDDDDDDDYDDPTALLPSEKHGLPALTAPAPARAPAPTTAPETLSDPPLFHRRSLSPPQDLAKKPAFRFDSQAIASYCAQEALAMYGSNSRQTTATANPLQVDWAFPNNDSRVKPHPRPSNTASPTSLTSPLLSVRLKPIQSPRPTANNVAQIIALDAGSIVLHDDSHEYNKSGTKPSKKRG